MILIDSNVLLDVLTNDPTWREWSESQILSLARTDELAINPLIYAEISTSYRTATALEKALKDVELVRLPLPYEAAFVATQAFHSYRKRDGTKRSPLPDFYIGAHAHIEGHRLLTRDAPRYRTYFPKVRLISPG